MAGDHVVTTLSMRPLLARGAWVLAGLTVCTLIAWGLSIKPWLVGGVVLGGVLFVATIARPLIVLGFMLVIGPIDLSFVTGGFKSLLEEQGGLDMNGIRLIGVVIALSAITAVDRDVLRHAVGRYGRWYLLFLVYAGATLAVSSAPLDGLRLLMKLAYPLLLFIAILGVTRTREDLETLTTHVLIGAAVIAGILAPILVALGQYEVEQGRIRIPLIGVHENPMSFYLLVMILISFARYLTRGHLRYLVLSAVFASVMAVTLTRITVGAAIASLLGGAFFSALVSRNARGFVAGIALACVIGLPLMPFALERTFGYVPTLGSLFTMMSDPLHLFSLMNWQGREIFWPVVLKAFTDNPLFGLGIGSSTAVLLANFPPEWGMVVHNEYLRLASETGLVGLVLFGAAVFAWCAATVRCARGATDTRVREFALPAFSAIIACAMVSLTDNSFDYYSSFTQYIGFLCAATISCAAMSGVPVDA